MVLDDIREYVFALYMGPDPAGVDLDQAIGLEKQNFLGTSFFVSQNGIALAAAHCIPKPDALPEGQKIVAALWDGATARAHLVVAATFLDDYDVAILKIKPSRPLKHLQIGAEELAMGSDVVAVGLPQHSVSGQGHEFRCLKGHVTFVTRFLELSFAVPRGMSGSPVFNGSAVGAVLTGNVRSEALEDLVEERTEIVAGHTVIRRIESRAVINYGLAEPLSKLLSWRHEITGDRPFGEFIKDLNSRTIRGRA